MKRQINYTELFSQANRRASEILKFDRYQPKEYNKETRQWERQPAPNKHTWRTALSQAFRELYQKFEVVVSISADELLQRIREEQTADEIARFYTHSTWNVRGWTGD